MKTFKQFLREDKSHIENHPIEKMRDYSSSEFPWEYREVEKYAPHHIKSAFKSQAHFKQEYDKAPLRHLSHHEIRHLEYSTAAGYLHNSSVPEKTTKAHDEFSHRRDLGRIHDELHSGKMAPPIVVKHSRGMRMLGGNTRLSYGLSQNKNIPVRVIDISNNNKEDRSA